MASSSHMGGSHKGNSKKRSETTTSKTGRRIKRDAPRKNINAREFSA